MSRATAAKWCTESPDHVTMPDNEMVTGGSSGQLAQLNSVFSASGVSEIAYNLILDEPALVRACRIIERAWIAHTILHYDYSYSDDANVIRRMQFKRERRLRDSAPAPWQKKSYPSVASARQSAASKPAD